MSAEKGLKIKEKYLKVRENKSIMERGLTILGRT